MIPLSLAKLFNALLTSLIMFKFLFNDELIINCQEVRMENLTPYIVIFVLLVGIPVFVRLFFRKNSEDSNVTDRMLEWQQKQHDDRVKKQHNPWTGE